MAGKVNPIPQGYHTITPNMVVKEAENALEFYKRAFGADETVRMPGPDGRIMHAELRIGNSMIMLAEERLEMDAKSPKTLGGTPVGFYVYVENVDTAWKRAVDAGAWRIRSATAGGWPSMWQISPRRRSRRVRRRSSQGLTRRLSVSLL